MGQATQQHLLYAKSIAPPTHKPSRISISGLPKATMAPFGFDWVNSNGSLPASPVFYGRVWHELTPASQYHHEQFYYDCRVSKYLSERPIIAQFYVPANGPVAAASTLTVATNPTLPGDIIRVGSTTYNRRLVTALASQNDVLIGANTSETARNIAHSYMEHAGTSGVQYQSSTEEHPSVIATWSGSAVTFTSRLVGTLGNSIQTSITQSDMGGGTSNGVYTGFGSTLTGGGQASLTAGQYLYHAPSGQQGSNLSPFFGEILGTGTYMLLMIEAKSPVTVASNSGVILALDGADLNGGSPFALNFSTQGTGQHRKADTGYEFAVTSSGGSSIGQTLSARVSANSIPAGTFVNLLLRRVGT